MTINNTECPRKLFFQHLSEFLTSRLHSQEQLILMGDFNHVIDSEPITQFLQQHHLHNVHHTLHTHYNTYIPTHARGSRTIDAIFASPGIIATKGGFLGFSTFPSDHRLLWCDLSVSMLFDTPQVSITPHNRRRLQCEDPRIVNKFTKKYESLLLQHRLPTDLQTLLQSISGPLNPSQQQEYERLDKLRVRSMLQAEQTCRKFKLGGIEFSPKIQHQRDRINLWRNVQSKMRGNKVSLSLITRLERKVGISQSLSYSMEDIKSHLSDAFSKYKQLKTDKGTIARDEWFENLAAAKAAAHNTTLASELLQQ